MLHIQTLVQPCHCIPPPPSTSSFAPTLFTTHSPHSATHSPSPLLITPFYSLSPRSPPIFSTFSSPRKTHRFAYSQDDVFDEFSSAQSLQRREADAVRSIEELELRNKPPLVSVDVDGSAPGSGEPQEEDEALAPFLRFFKGKESLDEVEERVTEAGPAAARDDESRVGSVVDDEEEKDGEVKKVGVEYYEPRPGDFVVGVVVSGNENRLDVNVGADLLGTMLTKEVLPLYDKEMDYLLCDLKDGAEHFMVRGKMGIIHYDDVVKGGPVPGRPVVDTGTVLFAEVLGRTLSGRPLLSTRRLFRRIAWHRVRQIKQLNEPIEVKITQWNTGGLLTRIEGLRAFLPKAELVNRANNYTELKQNVGRRIQVLITRIDEDKNDLILSEKEAWGMLHLQEGTLLDGTVKKILPYGAQVRIGDSNRSGLLHISKISATRITSVSSVLKVDEKVKVLVVKSMFPDKISLSIVDLESEPGLFILNKERVFSEAEIMAKKYRQKLPVTRTTKFEDSPTNPVPFDSEASLYANWKWFKFEKEDE